MATCKEIRRFDVVFRDPTATFKAGDVVAGSVQLELAMDLKMKGVKLFLQGISRVQWDENRAYTKGSSSKLSHKNVDVYLDEPVVLVSKVDGNVMRAGRYDWPFTVRLPPYIPASFEGQHGRVQYWAKAVIDRPWKGDNDVTRQMVVTGILDLNTDSEAKNPTENSSETMAGRLCCKSGPVTGHVSLPTRGFVSGQNIPFSVFISNGSTSPLRNVRLTLTQVVVYRADKQTRRQTTMLKGMTWRDVNAGEDAKWEDELKHIPTMPPSKLGAGCKTIDVKYQVILSGKPAKGGQDMETCVEVIIGTIPLRKTESSTPLLTVKAAARQRRASCEIDPVDELGRVRASPRPSPRPSPKPLRTS